MSNFEWKPPAWGNPPPRQKQTWEMDFKSYDYNARPHFSWGSFGLGLLLAQTLGGRRGARSGLGALIFWFLIGWAISAIFF